MSTHDTMIHCLPYGTSTRSYEVCDHAIPNLDYDTMERFGWGWGWAPDCGAASGQGPFAMCAEHRDTDHACDRPQEARTRAVAKMQAAEEEWNNL